jgi:hypothetical protein
MKLALAFILISTLFIITTSLELKPLPSWDTIATMVSQNDTSMFEIVNTTIHDNNEFLTHEFTNVNQKIEKLQADKDNLVGSIVLVLVIMGLVVL